MGRMRGATCFLFKIFQTNRLLPLPCFPLWAGFACFITDCRLSFIFLVFAFHLSPCFPLRGKCLHKQTIEVNFNFFDFDTAFPSGAGIARFLTDCCKSHKFKISAFVIGFPLGGSCQRKLTDEGHRFPHRSKCVQTTERSQFNYFSLRQMQIIRTLKNRGSYYFLQCLSTRQSSI